MNNVSYINKNVLKLYYESVLIILKDELTPCCRYDEHLNTIILSQRFSITIIIMQYSMQEQHCLFL